MIRTIIGTLALGLLISAQANAASWTITGPDEVTVGDTFTLEVFADHGTEGLFAGGVIFSFDATQFSLTSLLINDQLTNAGFTCPGPNQPGCDEDASDGAIDIVVGNLLPPVVGGMPVLAPGAGTTLIATLTLECNPCDSFEGSAMFNLLDNAGLVGGWFDGNNDFTTAPDFFGKSVQVNSTVVPLPAAVWFMIGGLGTLLGFRRK